MTICSECGEEYPADEHHQCPNCAGLEIPDTPECEYCGAPATCWVGGDHRACDDCYDDAYPE